MPVCAVASTQSPGVQGQRPFALKQTDLEVAEGGLKPRGSLPLHYRCQCLSSSRSQRSPSRTASGDRPRRSAVVLDKAIAGEYPFAVMILSSTSGPKD